MIFIFVYIEPEILVWIYTISRRVLYMYIAILRHQIYLLYIN